ncbi:MAG: divalent-cation tolerance protein CutA [Verrucomicrobia bacterium]|nr:MAG: divalent-cation tolerance protein CutA [Verrucomicrobiota bacterium]
MKFILVYITAATRAEANRISQVLLREHLVACVNMVGPMASLYWWRGRLKKSREVLVLAKTRATLAQRVIQKVRALHGYDVPCVVTLPLAQGNPQFLRWIATETRTNSSAVKSRACSLNAPRSARSADPT